jgi:uncharacterized protein YqhQ
MPPTPAEKQTLGGMALANGLLVHGARHWAAAIRDGEGRLVVASGRKTRLARGRLAEIPVARGILRLGEAFAVLPAVRRGLPEARLAMEDARTGVALLASAAITAVARRKLPSVLAQEAVGAASGLVPALMALRGSRAAIWHAVEHKSIAAYEAGEPGEMPDAADHAKEHDRCGSNLVLPLLVTSTLANTVSRKLFPRRRIGARAGMTLLGVGAAVEVFAFATRRPEHLLSRTVHGFGHALQTGFATREPSAGDLLVGRAAMDALLRAEGADRPEG